MNIELPIGTRVKVDGKHCIVTPMDEGEDMGYICINHCAAASKDVAYCMQVPCVACNRSDKKDVYFKEII